MKKNIKIILLISMLALGGACTDYLDLPPANKKSVVSVDDVKSIVSTMLYNYTKPGFGTSGHVVRRLGDIEDYTLAEIYSDNIDFEDWEPRPLAVYPIDQRYYEIFTSTFLPSNSWAHREFSDNIWRTRYKAIGDFNTWLDLLAEVTGSVSEKEIIEGELKIIRAFMFFKLLQKFSSYNDGTLGIPVHLTTNDGVSGVGPERKTHTEAYMQIISDLERVLEIQTAPEDGWNVLFNKQYANSILAQVYWFKAESPAKEETDYANAKTYAEAALNNTDIMTMTEFNAYDFNKSVTPRSTPSGFVYGLKNDPYGHFVYGINYYGPTYSVVNNATSDLLALYEPFDIRLNKYFRGGTIVDRHTKYGNFQYMFWRAEEMLLIAAEAALNSGATAEALTLLNKLRDERGATALTTVSVNEIIDERRREFCFEYDMRWIDIIRYQIPVIRNHKGTTDNLTADDYRKAYPIPAIELEYNPNIKQNPGWN